MIAIIFEVTPHDGKKDEYLSIAASMRSLVEQIDGFISVERFQSLTNPEKLLSISFYETEAAVDRWRQLTEHRNAQSVGRDRIFKDYRIRVLSVIRDYGMTDRDEAPADSRQIHDQGTPPAEAAT
jgi:heme-degrading monooxygenase HmoA